MKRTRLAIGALLLLACAPVHADDGWALCPVYERPPPAANPDDPTIHITADRLDAESGLLSGRVTLEQGGCCATRPQTR